MFWFINNKDQYIYIFDSDIKNYRQFKFINFDVYELLLDVIELKNGTILGTTNKAIYKLIIKDNKNENDEIIRLYKITYEWLIPSEILNNYRGLLDMYELPNNKLLIHSHSFDSSQLLGIAYRARFQSKIFIININDFEIIHFTRFNNNIYYIIVNNYICIAFTNCIYIYNINNYSLLKEIAINIKSINTYNKNTIIILEENNNIILYDLSDLNNLKFKIYKNEILRSFEYNSDLLKSICRLNKRKIIVIIYNIAFIFEIPENIDFLPINYLLDNNDKQ